MSNFLIFFDEKEGTSHLMVLLDHFAGVSIVHQTEKQGWEPFDSHLHQGLTTRALMQCLDLLYGPGKNGLSKLNRIYMLTASRPLEAYNYNDDVGFKMRFCPPSEPGRLSRIVASLPWFGPDWAKKLDLERRYYQQRLFSMLRRHNVVVLFAVRQDLFRWALSKYHGDGSGQDGHLQFALADGKIDASELPSIEVDPDKFRKIINHCRYNVKLKRHLMRLMEQAGIKIAAIIYEDYLSDPYSYFHKLMGAINHPVTDAEIETALKQGSWLKKVHSHEISDFVSNHKEIEAEFGDCAIEFEQL